MIPTRIFLDLDDTLNLFTLYALQYVGCPIDPAKGYGQYDAKYGWDIVRAASELHPHCVFTSSSFWNRFNEDAWSDVPTSPELPMLLRNCVALVGRENICILSAPVESPGCLEGKEDWIREYLPSWLHNQYLIGRPKHFCARPDALLIDDADHNIDVFRKYGGRTITVPRPWNRFAGYDTTEHLGRVFQEFLERKRNWRDMKRGMEPKGTW